MGGIGWLRGLFRLGAARLSLGRPQSISVRAWLLPAASTKKAFQAPVPGFRAWTHSGAIPRAPHESGVGSLRPPSYRSRRRKGMQRPKALVRANPSELRLLLGLPAARRFSRVARWSRLRAGRAGFWSVEVGGRRAPEASRSRKPATIAHDRVT